MAYKQSIANEIMELYKNAPKDKTTNCNVSVAYITKRNYNYNVSWHTL